MDEKHVLPKIVSPMIECLQPERPKVPPKIRCQAMRITKYASDYAGCDLKCKHSALYRINGHVFCKRHAEKYALKILLKMNDDGIGYNLEEDEDSGIH